MTTANSSWYTSTATTSTADNYFNWIQTTATATGDIGVPLYYNQAYQTYQTYSTPAPFDPEIVRRNQEMRRRMEPLECWRGKNERRLDDRRKKEQTEASDLARRLLMEYLDERNKKNFADEKPLEVRSGIHQGIKYQIPNYDGRIKAWRGDRVVSELCLQVKAPEWIPPEDKLLAKLLYLQSDEAQALCTANHFNMIENLREGIN